MFTILGQNDWKVHGDRLYKYVNGAWIKKETLTLDNYDPLTCAGGILIQLADFQHIEWKWEPISE